MADKKPFRYGGRKLGTAYGEREHQKARRDRVGAHIEAGLGIGQMVAGGAVMVMGVSNADPFMTLAGSGMIASAGTGEDRRKRASARAAHGTAVEGLIAKSRGGSVALGMRGVVPAKQSPADRMRAGASHLGGPKPKTDMREGKGIKGADGIAPMARELARDPQAMQDAMQSVFDNNPDLKAQLEKESAGGNAMSKSMLDGSFPKGERDIQRSFDAIHEGTGGRSNGMGQVWKDPQPDAAARMRDGAMKLGVPVSAADRKAANAPAPAAPQSRIQKKYSGAKTKTGERIMDKAAAMRRSSKFFKGVGHATTMGSVAFGPEGMILGIPAGAASQMVGVSQARDAENLRMKSRAVDTLITRHRTGSSFGVNRDGMKKDWTPTKKTTSIRASIGWGGFNKANAGFKARQAESAKAADDQQAAGPTGKPRGWANAKTQAAAKAAQGKPFNGFVDDGMGH